MRNLHFLFSSLLFLLFTGCSSQECKCPLYPAPDLSQSQIFASHDDYMFRFPLDNLDESAITDAALFHQEGRKSEKIIHYHCAEDYHRPPGEPVYSITDGVISYSGKMGGYGWLVIIDHPDINLYSLYGHLSQSRWSIQKGKVVKKGALIGYLGDSYENGGSKENPLVPHLHFGIRTGQRDKFPGKSDWRWMAGWIGTCPVELGWLQPSSVINAQAVPPGGFINPEAGFFILWRVEIILGSIYLFGAATALIYALKKKKIYSLFIYSSIMIAAGILFRLKYMNLSYVVWSIALVFLIIAIIKIKQSKRDSESQNRPFA